MTGPVHVERIPPIEGDLRLADGAFVEKLAALTEELGDADSADAELPFGDDEVAVRCFGGSGQFREARRFRDRFDQQSLGRGATSRRPDRGETCGSEAAEITAWKV